MAKGALGRGVFGRAAVVPAVDDDAGNRIADDVGTAAAHVQKVVDGVAWANRDSASITQLRMARKMALRASVACRLFVKNPPAFVLPTTVFDNSRIGLSRC